MVEKILKDILIILIFVVPVIVWFLMSFGLGWLRWLIFQS